MRRADVAAVGFMAGIVVTMMLTPEPETEVRYETRVRYEQVEVEVEPEPEPEPDRPVGWVDFDEMARQDRCLFDLMQRDGHAITLENVMRAGEWADANGGACTLLERES